MFPPELTSKPAGPLAGAGLIEQSDSFPQEPSSLNSKPVNFVCLASFTRSTIVLQYAGKIIFCSIELDANWHRITASRGKTRNKCPYRFVRILIILIHRFPQKILRGWGHHGIGGRPYISFQEYKLKLKTFNFIDLWDFMRSCPTRSSSFFAFSRRRNAPREEKLRTGAVANSRHRQKGSDSLLLRTGNPCEAWASRLSTFGSAFTILVTS